MFTLVPRRPGRYASFPTFTVTGDHLYLFYREGRCGDPRTHGEGGRVKRARFNRKKLLAAMDRNDREDLSHLVEETVILFERDNEMDAIVTRLHSETYALATRTFSPPDNRMNTYLSLSSTPDFSERVKVTVPGVQWLVFYGKGVSLDNRFIFPAYGGLTGDKLFRPLLITTQDGASFELFSHLPSPVDGIHLNESSLALLNGARHIFMRQGEPPFGIWHATSPDLKTWTRPRRLLTNGHAPMALAHENRILLSWRHLHGKVKAATALSDPFDGPVRDLETYEGSIYDGGYSDLGIVDGSLLVFYYQGNHRGEPFIRCARIIS